MSPHKCLRGSSTCTFQLSIYDMIDERLVGCLGFNGTLSQYFNLQRVVSQKGRKKDEGKMSKQPPPAPTAGAIGPCPTAIQISRTPRHSQKEITCHTDLHLVKLSSETYSQTD